jgi:hypothetical protein
MDSLLSQEAGGNYEWIFHPNKMQACKRSMAPATSPPTVIANTAFLFVI